MPITLYIDADACPVKDEVYKVAARYGLTTIVVANQPILIPRDPLIERRLVPEGPDKADDAIADEARPGVVVVTADIPLAARCVKAGATVLSPTGKVFDENAIGMALATRNLMDGLRSAGVETRGPKPFDRRDRSAFLQALDTAIVKLKRQGFG